MRNSSKYIIFATILYFSIATMEVNACICAGNRPPCEAYGQASAVFIGLVTSDSFIYVKDSEHRYQQRLVSFAIEEIIHGLSGPTTDVITGLGGGDCGFGFKRGEHYLVYTYTNPENKKLYASSCSRTRLLSEASEDLRYIRGLSSALPGSLIFGKVQRYRPEAKGGGQETAMTGIKVNIDGEEKQVETRTDLKGEFSVGGLPSGTYKIKISVPPGLMSYSVEQEIKVADRGCAMLHFSVVPDGRLSGKVLSVNGQPILKAEISLCNPEEKRYRQSLNTVYTDKDGLYEFKAIPPGRYVLGVRFDGLTSQNRPFPQLYYPSVENIDQATIVSIGEGEIVEKYDLILPLPPDEHTVEGVVVWSDGKPAPNVWVEYSQIKVPIGYGTKPDRDGRFSFKVYDGLKITMRATMEIEKGKYIYSDWVETSVLGEDVKVKIVLPGNQ